MAWIGGSAKAKGGEAPITATNESDNDE